tara:strand:+ start:516 stop:668 length:153 start_codon:yes stop_codon:yes gene_type:complete
MANEIKKALEEAVEKDNESPELSARVKKLLARKQNLRRKSHNPKRIRRDK